MNQLQYEFKSLVFVCDLVYMDSREPSGYLHFFFICANYIRDKKVKWNTEENDGDFQHSLKDLGFIK